MKVLFAGLVVAVALATAASVCVPGKVTDFGLLANYTLYWNNAQNPNNCTITAYVINIFDNEENVKLELQASVTVNLYNVSFLDMCKSYSFEIHALTNENVLGPSDQRAAITPILANANLNISALNASALLTNINVNWELVTPQVGKCVTYYRVVFWDRNNNPKDVYVTSKNFTLAGDVPCMQYHFQVNAIVVNPDIEGPIGEVVVNAPGAAPALPTIVSLNTTVNTATMTWRLQPYSQNSCQLSSLRVYTVGAPANSSLVTVPITDTAARPDVTVTITGLSASHVYTSYVSLTGTGGTSQNVTVYIQTPNTFGFFGDYSLSYD